MLEKITTALEQLETQGSFSARKTTDAEDLHIEINPIGWLRFPLKPTVVRKLIKVARPATFGWRDQTQLDTEVRNTWKLPKSRVKIDKRRWNKTLNPTMDRLKDELGLSEQDRLRAELHDMLIYAPGQFFMSHQDSEKCDGMVATLVVVLPSPHSGGTLIVDHQGEKKRYQSSRASGDKLTFFAFYADCQHEVRPVTEGYRVVLIYNLILEEGTEKVMLPSPGQAQQSLTEALGSYFAAPPTEGAGRGISKKIVYLLDHQYTPKGISWKALKSADRLRASALAEAAGALDLEVHLALADIRETWDCEMDEPSWGYGSRRRYWDDYDDDEEMEEDGDDEGSAELLDLIDDSTTIKHWRDAQGQIVSLPEWYVSGSEICWTKANGELDPSQSEYEGWMGNYGNTMERWYHRAAIILWRRDERYAALLEIAPEVMIRELLRLAEKKTMRAQSQEIVRCLLPNWSGLRGSDTKPSSFNRIFRLALRLDASEPAQGLLLPLGIDALCPETAQAMIRLQTAYGAQWLIEVLRTWLDSSTYPVWGSIIDRLSPIIKRWVEHAPGDHGELTHWLLGRQLGALKRKQLHQVQADAPVTYAKNAPGRIAKITDLLSASLLSLDSAIFAEMIDHLIADDSSYPVFDLVEIARYVKRQNRQVGGVGGHCARLLEFVRGKLTTALDSPPRRPDDWSIQEKNRCGCADCRVLNTFLQSGRLESKVWPLAKGRRQHIHGVIDGMGIPVTHRTERSGSPHKLHLAKTKQLFVQEQKQRDHLKKALDDLAK